jgi:predicted transcriptional regulator
MDQVIRLINDYKSCQEQLTDYEERHEACEAALVSATFVIADSEEIQTKQGEMITDLRKDKVKLEKKVKQGKKWIAGSFVVGLLIGLAI